MDIHRYLADFNAKDIEKEHYDVLIIGSGIAGVYTALEIEPMYSVAILTKESIDISNSVLAQGGIAVSLDKEDSPELHFKDTIYAGAGMCDEKSVWVLVNEAVQNIESLCKYGVNFDRESSLELSLSKEAAHSKRRIIHAGDTTGKEVCDKLTSVVKERSNVRILERMFAVDLLTWNDECKGILAFDEEKGEYRIFLSKAVVCATGGFGQIYSNTTNPEVATGDGLCLAYRAGAELMDLEFVQFHPTVLYHKENKSFLISEAVRGEGAVLRNCRGERFMPLYHELKELAPRDIVSRAIFEEMRKTGSEHVYLDITFKDRDFLENRFPNIFRTCLSYGIDISKAFIPVAPAEHYCMGGIKADVFGRTNIKWFYACGEAACNGIHGANRLASNSLLEGLVFGHKTGKEISEALQNRVKEEVCFEGFYITDREFSQINAAGLRRKIQEIMTRYAGILRDRSGLSYARDELEKMHRNVCNAKCKDSKDFELQNILLLSRLVVESALEREESRGAHYRTDFCHMDDVNWKRNIVRKKA
ncbi:MAG: L-aspartate oxidase [Clostridia bacterium]|nr:L-aspartate oxidase [Clostridia bacterium]